MLFAAVGGAAALVLDTVGSALAAASAAAGPAAGPQYRVAATALEDAIVVAIWQTFGAVAFGVFALGIGRLLRAEQRWLGRLTLFIGGDALAVALARIAGLEAVAIVTIVVWLPLLTVWSGWLALAALREDRSERTLAA